MKEQDQKTDDADQLHPGVKGGFELWLVVLDTAFAEDDDGQASKDVGEDEDTGGSLDEHVDVEKKREDDDQAGDENGDDRGVEAFVDFGEGLRQHFVAGEGEGVSGSGHDAGIGGGDDGNDRGEGEEDFTGVAEGRFGGIGQGDRSL